MDIVVAAEILVAGYLLGSIPTGFLVGKAKGIDIREHGSKNIGATNVFRTLGKKYGIFVFLCDALKGFLAVRLGIWLESHAVYTFSGPVSLHDTVYVSYHLHTVLSGILGAVACILGHNFPVWLKFKGGKGVATSLGVIIGLVPLQAGIAFVLWLAVLFVSGYVSLASIIAALSVPVTVAIFAESWQKRDLLIFTSLAALLIVLRHKANIKRLLNGTENSFKKSKEKSNP